MHGGDSLANASGDGAEILRGMGRGLSPAHTHRSIDDPSLLTSLKTARAGPPPPRAAEPRPPRRRTNPNLSLAKKCSAAGPLRPPDRQRPMSAGHNPDPATSLQHQDHPDRQTIRCKVTGLRRHRQPRRHAQPERLIRVRTRCQPAICRGSEHQAQTSAGDAEALSPHAQPR